MQPCEYTERMSLSLDGLLSESEEAGLQAHLAECEPCRMEWEAMCWASSALRAEPAASPGADLTLRVTARIAQREARRRRVRGSVRLLSGAIGLWALAGLASVLAFLLLWQPPWYVLLLNVLLPVTRVVLTTLAALGNAFLSVVRALSGEPLVPLLVVCVAAVAASLTVWMRIVSAHWSLAVQADGWTQGRLEV